MSGLRRDHAQLTLTLAFTASHVVVGINGELDLMTAPDLGALLTAIADRGHTRLVLDLADLAFVDAGAIQVIAAISIRLQPAGGVVVLRSPSWRILRVLDITGVRALVQIERADLQRHLVALGPEQLSDEVSVAASRDGAASGIGRFAWVADDDEVVDAALGRVVALARATVGGADGVSVSLSRQGEIQTVASSDATVAQMDQDQYTTGEGPCLAAAAEGHWFHVDSLADELRWPAFIPRALASGILSILSTPLLVADRPVGALNIYSVVAHAFGRDQQAVAALFASQASGILSDAAVDITGENVGSRLRDALRSREVIAQAQGVLMERTGATADEAYSSLCEAARGSDIPLRRLAVDIVASACEEIDSPS